MTFKEQIALAHNMGATYDHGRWTFPSPEAKQKFERIVDGLEWTPEQTAVAAAALVAERNRGVIQ